MVSIGILMVSMFLHQVIISKPTIPGPDHQLASVVSNALLISSHHNIKRSLNDGGSSSNMCSICKNAVEEGQVRRWPNCGHPFHSGCMSPWFVQTGSTCPLCRGSGVNREQTTVLWQQEPLPRGQENSPHNPNPWTRPSQYNSEFANCPTCSTNCRATIPPIEYYCNTCKAFWRKPKN
ncbi:Zinc finger, C3HC4 type (RING finger) [Puccinia graminis f. sp. tritici]|uniref:Zinc finger, C3HC4 type (RING finger) n=1 Tax=Puccinia graminis f. sp. tritici TaxID=56615 RepID=A0A5B0NZC8_PUCGR|nr:Zinc finger, C3HC4 type (RING finger) [Puccinia graminis f. sp. tritici]KAA1129013.1 Zinc finger, C3HC4 type (RING finger) [Puccinia graminis f. sp. tritici]